MPVRLSITRESFFILLTSSMFYYLHKRIGAARSGGVVDDVTLALVGGFDAGDEG